MKYELDKLKLCEFDYVEDGEIISLLYIGKDKTKGAKCNRCEKPTKNAHYFVLADNETEARYFGSECVSHVFGTVGLKE
jgi:hypothetical protein